MHMQMSAGQNEEREGSVASRRKPLCARAAAEREEFQ